MERLGKPINNDILEKFMRLAVDNNVIVCYVWIDGSGETLRSKSRTLNFYPHEVNDIPVWNFDGSSTKQATDENSDVFLKPVAMFRDPFRRGPHKLVLCETETFDHQPHPTNFRRSCFDIMIQAKDRHPWFGMEQEYFILDVDGRPLGWPKNGFPRPMGPYYCSVGSENAFGRQLVDAHYMACLYAGIKLCGENAEVSMSQWEFQVGPCEGIEAGDQLWIARYILIRVAEEFGYSITFDPKPVSGNWNGTGCHTNYSTIEMRKPNGLEKIIEASNKLSKKHQEHILKYDPNGGLDNRRRLLGKFETSSIDKFTWTIANRGCSVRIPRQVQEDKSGYLEDRRPAGNCDPYLVTEALVKTTCID